jgi:hypothetical protein
MRLREGLSLCVRGALCAAMCALTLGASSAKAAPLPAGLESSCPFAGCVISYSDPTTGGNGHYYAYVPTGDHPVTWTAASTAAAASKLGQGSVGYLATVTSSVENDFIVQQILPLPSAPQKKVVWLGGIQNDTPVPSLPADAGWQWIRPESWIYTNWAPGEPNDEGVAGGDERYLTMWVHFFVASVDQRGSWNDEDLTPQAQAPNVGFIVEYEAPEPGTALLAVLGVALLARRSRR